MDKLTFKEIFEKGVWCQPYPIDSPTFYDFDTCVGKQMILGVDPEKGEYFCGPYNRFYYLKDYGKSFAFNVFELEGLEYYQTYMEKRKLTWKKLKTKKY